MLTRLKVSGFKNLVDVDIRFGPFTCIAGPNAVGKSNLFDAIRFLSALADRPLLDAALSVRDEGGRSADLRGIFQRVGSTSSTRMTIEAEMIVPPQGQDDLGQPAEAGITFLRYVLEIGLRPENGVRLSGGLEVIREELTHINLGDAKQNLRFPHHQSWRTSAIKGRRSSPFISTEGEGPERKIRRHQDGNGGRTLQLRAADLPRTVLSVSNAAESPTALLARREMQSWRLLQLEPSALRKPDEFGTPSRMGADGSHLAATLWRLAHSSSLGTSDRASPTLDEGLYARVANRLSKLIGDVRSVQVDWDERRELMTLMVTGGDGTPHPARSLSDGTLRFLALATIELDPDSDRLLCLEEPENGVHPARIPAILSLLESISTDVDEPIGPENPLRQVIINTHSPLVVGQAPDDSLLLAQPFQYLGAGQRAIGVRFSGLSDTWRESTPDGQNAVSKGTIISYLHPCPEAIVEDSNEAGGKLFSRPRRRVMDRKDLLPTLSFDA